MTFSKAVALRTLKLLAEKNLTQYRLLKNIGMEPHTFQNLTKERTKDVKLSTVAILAEGLGLTLKEFFNDNLFDTIDFDI